MLRELATRFLCLCLALMVAAQLAVPMAGAADLPCHTADMVTASADGTHPCPVTDPTCPGKGCISHAVALPVPPQRLPQALNIPARMAGFKMSLLRPLQTTGGLLRPPKA